MPAQRSEEQVRTDIDRERHALASAVDELRGSLGRATDVAGKVKEKLPVVAAAAAGAGFVLAGGIGATVRYFARRGREGHERARLGRFSVRER